MTYTPPTVAAPMQLPWALDRVVSGALAVLRLEPSDVDAARLQHQAIVATRKINEYLDLEAIPEEWVPDFGDNPPAGDTVTYVALPPELYEAAVNLTVELYRRKDAPFGVSDSWSADGALVRLSSDVMKGTRSLIAGHKGRWGIA